MPSSMEALNNTNAITTIYGPSDLIADGHELEFGTIVRSNGQVMVVTAPHYGKDDEGGVFVYNNNNNNNHYHLQWYLIGNTLDAIGGRISVSETCIAVGRKNTIEIYYADTGIIRGKPVNSFSGNDLSLVHDDLLLIGEDRYNTRQGQVRMLQYDGSNDTWSAIQTLSGLQQTDSRFGWVIAVSADGTRVAVSAPNASRDFIRQGYVQVMERNVQGLWQPLGSILFGAVEEGQFGFSLAMSGDGSTIVVGSPGTVGGGVTAYRYADGLWEQIGSMIVAIDTGSRFGRSVAVSFQGDRIAATSYLYDSARGHARVFDFVEEAWVEQYNINGSMVGDRLGAGNFGLELAPDGLILMVGAVLADNPAGISTGTVTIADLGMMTSLRDQQQPSSSPTLTSSDFPTNSPTLTPTRVPSDSPTSAPTRLPSSSPTTTPTRVPYSTPTSIPTITSSVLPFLRPSLNPTPPFANPSSSPINDPSVQPNTVQSMSPTTQPTIASSINTQPSAKPSQLFNALWTDMPTFIGSDVPGFPSMDNDLPTPIDHDKDHDDPGTVVTIKGSGGATPEIFGTLGLTLLLWRFF